MVDTRVKFAMRSGDPVLLVVQAHDGQQYELRVAMAVFSVIQGETDPTTGIPAFSIKAHPVLEVTKMTQPSDGGA